MRTDGAGGEDEAGGAMRAVSRIKYVPKTPKLYEKEGGEGAVIVKYKYEHFNFTAKKEYAIIFHRAACQVAVPRGCIRIREPAVQCRRLFP